MSSLRAIAIFIAFATILIVLFSFLTIVTNLSNELTGNVVVIEGPATDSNLSSDTVVILKELNDNLKCWLDRGLTEQDLLVAGHLLRDMSCVQTSQTQPVTATVTEECITATIGDEGTTTVCTGNRLNLQLTKPPHTILFPKSLNVPVYNYAWYGVYIFFIVIIVLFWREYEFRKKTDYELKAEQAYMKHKKERKKPKKQKKALPKLKPAPPYDLKKHKKRLKEQKATARTHKQDGHQRKQVKLAQKNGLITAFNTLSAQLHNDIMQGKILTARKGYMKLFSHYSKLNTIVSKKTKQRLDSVMEYFCHYLGALEQMKGKQRSGLHETLTKTETIKPTPKVMNMATLDEMKDLIDAKQYDRAKSLFYTEEKQLITQQPTNKEKDALDAINKRHDTILRDGLVNVQDDDYYRFMMNMHSLRKSLTKGKKKKKR